MTDPRYTPREKSSSARINDAVKHTKRRRSTKPSTTDIEQDADAKRRYDENYDAIFGKRELKHGRD
jgi:hypothetical protein